MSQVHPDWPRNITYAGDIDWMPWVKKFAWLPVEDQNNRKIWLSTYYERYGRRKYIFQGTPLRQIGTLFDVLKT